MPPDLILSMWLMVARIMFGDKMETDTNNESVGQRSRTSMKDNSTTSIHHNNMHFKTKIKSISAAPLSRGHSLTLSA